MQSESGAEAPYDEVLLTLGQPPAEPDAQWADWQEHAGRREAEVAQAYPAAKLRARAAAWQSKHVAIRGLGLSTYDVLRGLTLAQGGRFDAAGYHASGREPCRILPFSLNGQPPSPSHRLPLSTRCSIPHRKRPRASPKPPRLRLMRDPRRRLR